MKTDVRVKARLLPVVLLVAFSMLGAGCGERDLEATSEDGTADELGLSEAELSQGAILRGAALFLNEFPGVQGNGRTCATCHVTSDAFQLTPAHVEARWQALQQAKKKKPSADDPLFRSIDADDKQNNYSLLRQFALVRIVLNLPRDANGNKLIWPIDDPNATSVEVFRATPPARNLTFTAPYQYDGRFASLQQQALGALHGHAAIKKAPKASQLDDVAAFERTLFSSPKVALLSWQLEHGETAPPAPYGQLTPLETQGKALFATNCATCHGGPTQTKLDPILAASGAPVLDIFLSKPVAPFATDLPFAPSPVQSKTRLWAVRVPGAPEPVVRPSTDPGRVLITGKIEDFNIFDTPALYGIKDTAPYFRDNSAATLTDVIRHYQLLAEAIRRVVPPEAPFPVRPAAIQDADFAPLIAYLKKL